MHLKSSVLYGDQLNNNKKCVSAVAADVKNWKSS